MPNAYAKQLTQLQQQGQYRTLPSIRHEGKWIWQDCQKMLNFSSNDYLGLASDQALKQQFLAQIDWRQTSFGASSSRLLTGNFPIYAELEHLMASQFQREACLLFNSGYHANIGILPALADRHTLILADKLVHASLIDGIRLAGGNYQRYRHNDYTHLEQLLDKHSTQYQRIIVVTESVFSMDGDTADLGRLVALKQRYHNVMLYVDEAHAIGVLGQDGLGLAQEYGCIQQIDFLVGTFGKALAAMGAYLVCEQVFKDYLINKMRPLIFSTALSPVVVQWLYFLMQRLPHMHAQRQHLQRLSQQLHQGVQLVQSDLNHERSQMKITQAKHTTSDETSNKPSHIIPYVAGDNAIAISIAKRLQDNGFYCLPIRPPTVPSGTARIRFSLTADMTSSEVAQLIHVLQVYVLQAELG